MIAHVEVTIDEWIETGREKSWTIPEPRGRPADIRGSLGFDLYAT